MFYLKLCFPSINIFFHEFQNIFNLSFGFWNEATAAAAAAYEITNFSYFSEIVTVSMVTGLAGLFGVLNHSSQ